MKNKEALNVAVIVIRKGIRRFEFKSWTRLFVFQYTSERHEYIVGQSWFSNLGWTNQGKKFEFKPAVLC